jgi:hypothetical protein
MAGFGSQLTGYNKSISIQIYESDSAGNNVGSWKNAAFSEYITVRVTGTYSPITGSIWVPLLSGPMPILKAHTLDVKAVMYSEAN